MSAHPTGREPWARLGAALAPIAIMSARRHRALAPLAALLVHQTEEWVWPGGFLPRMNREMLGSDRDEFPLTRAIAYRINVVLGWSVSLAPSAGERLAPLQAALYANHLGNVALHVVWAARARRYNPGALSAVVLLLPGAVLGLRGVARPWPPPASSFAGAAVGCGAAAALVPTMRRRSRQAAASTGGNRRPDHRPL